MNDTKKEKPPKPKYNMWQNSAYMIALAWKRNEKKVPILCVLAAVFSVLTNLANLYIAPGILEKVEKRASADELLFAIAGFVGALILCNAATAYIKSNTLYGRVTVRMALVGDLNRKSGTTSYSNLLDQNFEKLMLNAQKSTGNNREASEAIWGTLETLLANVLGFAAYLFIMSYISPYLLAIILATSMAGYFISKYLYGYEYRHKEELLEHQDKLWHLIGRPKDYNAVKDIRIFGIRAWLTEMYEKEMRAFMAFHQKAQGIYFWAAASDLILAFLRNGLAYYYLIRLVLYDGLAVSEFLLYFSAIGGFTAWVSGILGNLGTLHRQSLDLSLIREALEYPETFLFEEGKPWEEEFARPCELRLEDVSFRYSGAAKDTLSHINLTLRPGEKLAIVGLNGAGKTTLIKLACGFLDPTEGRVLLNGKDIREYNRREYYHMFSAVFQDFTVLAGTVAMNVAQSEENIDMHRVKKCIHDAGLTAKIESLKGGYECLLNREIYEEAVMLSGGETQRLMLARALYRDAPFIVLDEPTAALDPIAEADMYQKYNEMTIGKSSIYISHRLASTRFCDRIIFLADAGIKEEGTHEALLAKNGQYAKLFEVQSKYYKESSGSQEKEGMEMEQKSNQKGGSCHA